MFFVRISVEELEGLEEVEGRDEGGREGSGLEEGGGARLRAETMRVGLVACVCGLVGLNCVRRMRLTDCAGCRESMSSGGRGEGIRSRSFRGMGGVGWCEIFAAYGSSRSLCKSQRSVM